MRRRDFIAGGLAIAGQTIVPAHAARAPIKRLIDAHCHLFNARDLPIEGFTKKVLIPEYKQLSSLFARYPDAFRVMIHALAEIMQEQAPLPVAEIKFVDGLDAGSARFPTADEQRTRDIANITRVLDKIWSKDILRELSVRNARAADVGIVDLQKLILQEVYPEIFSNHPGAEDVRLLIEQEGRNLPELARRLYDTGTERPIGRNVQWALLFTRQRVELAEQLRRLHRNRSALVTPALIDIALWVEDDHLTSIQDQVDVMTRVAFRRTGQRTHGFVGFDPLRQALHDKGGGLSAAPLTIVQRAIERGGFIGVKLYPPMGFRPIDNAGLGAAFPDYVREQLGAEPGAALDRALAKLYEWCAANGAPIMAHAVASNEAGLGYGLRANPKFWAMVLEKYPTLRINMAHFGGFREIGDPPKLDATWEWTIGRMFARTQSNAFADLSYYSEMLGDTGDKRKALLAHLASFRKAFPASADHLIFGSDWTMVGREAGFTPRRRNIDYVDLVGEFLGEAGYSDAEVDKIMFRNAVRFLGLSPADRQNGTRGRLEAFYASHGQSADWMKVFDA